MAERLYADRQHHYAVRDTCRMLERELNEAKRMIVWEFLENEIPSYTQGPEGEHEMTQVVSAKTINHYVKLISTLRREKAELREVLKLLKSRLEHHAPFDRAIDAARAILAAARAEIEKFKASSPQV